MIDFDSVTVFKLIGVSVLCPFLPLTAVTYYFFRRHRRTIEVERIFAILEIDPALLKVYALGMFPQRGVRWLTDRLPMLAPETAPSVRSAPLEMIEGIESDDIMRLEEVGIDTCYDLATADFMPLLLNTPYDARELVDWILQAKLCVYFGEAMKELRRHSIRTVIDLAQLTQEDIDALAPETALTKFALQRARKAVQDDPEIERLRKIGQLLGRFSGRDLNVSQ